MSKAGTWLRGSVVRKSGVQNISSSQSTRSSTPAQNVVSTATLSFGGGVKDPTGKVSEYHSMEDQCPVCKSDRYLNPKLRLLVSACYHKMCESCIDRLFTLGPAPCPICGKTLRKLAFMPQTFEDLTVEREVAVRRRLAKDFNKHREDFPDLRSYNDYLQEVEDITFNLINDIDVQQTEGRIAAFRRENAAIIEANIQKDTSYAASLVELEAIERQQREERARLLALEDEEERAARAAERAELLEKLEQSRDGVDAAALLAETTRRQREKERERRIKEREARERAIAAASAPRVRVNTQAVPDTPHIPVRDNWYAYDDKYSLRTGGYYDPMSEAVRRDREGIMRAGGYIVEEAWERALRCAVAGLDLEPLRGLQSQTSTVENPPNSSYSGDVVMAGT